MSVRKCLFGWLMLTVAVTANASGDRFESPTAGVTFVKPTSWVFVSAQTNQDNRDRVRLDDAELERAIKSQANPPLAMVMMHPEPYPDLNPSFQLGFRPLGPFEGKSPDAIIAALLPTIQSAYSDFEIVEPIRTVTVGGLPAARLGIRYTLRTTDGAAFPTRSDLIVVPRGKFMFFIGMGRKPDDLDAARMQQAMLDSVEIQP